MRTEVSGATHGVAGHGRQCDEPLTAEAGLVMTDDSCTNDCDDEWLQNTTFLIWQVSGLRSALHEAEYIKAYIERDGTHKVTTM